MYLLGGYLLLVGITDSRFLFGFSSILILFYGKLTKEKILWPNYFENEKSKFKRLKRKKHSQNIRTKSIHTIDKMSGLEFEKFLKKFFKKRGYTVETTPTSRDQGADLIIEKYGERIAIQAKRYEGNVGNKAIQEVLGAINYYNCDFGRVITNSYFTKSAKDLAIANGIELWNREKLIKKI